MDLQEKIKAGMAACAAVPLREIKATELVEILSQFAGHEKVDEITDAIIDAYYAGVGAGVAISSFSVRGGGSLPAGGPDWYALPDVIDFLGTTRTSALTWIKAGKLKARKVGGRWRIDKEDLAAFLNGNQ